MSVPPKQQTSPASAPHIPVSALEPSVPGDSDQLGGSLGPGAAPVSRKAPLEDPLPTLAPPMVL